MQNKLILVVDDQHMDLLILEDLLSTRYQVVTATTGQEALDYFAAGKTADLILLDVMMEGMDGFSMCRQLKSQALTKEIPIIFLTGLDSPKEEEYGLSLGAEDFIHKPCSAPVVLARVHNHLSLSAARAELRMHNQNLAYLVDQRTQEMLRQSEELLRVQREMLAAQGATIMAFCSLSEARDNETGNHIRRTQNYVLALANRLKHHPQYQAVLDDETIELLYKSAPLHDIGKVAVPDAILLKPGKLNEEEWQVMRCHCLYGRNAVMDAEKVLGNDSDSFLRYAREIAFSHHERWDGSGYPCGLARDSIPLSARLMAVADVYDALISKRVYKAAYSHETAIAMITEENGQHFDPDIVAVLLEISDQFAEIALQFNDGRL
jgi:putative two-component system response regulator